LRVELEPVEPRFRAVERVTLRVLHGRTL
jgi:hypothetical protein